MSHKFAYDWSLSDYPDKHGLKVFSTFACGGGSTMGYKLAGFDVLAANDIDPQMEKVYKANHYPKYFIKAPIKDLLDLELPEDLYGIDVLDGSPPCSVFSSAGLRDEAWGKEKMFREGQAKQVLDDLFFDFIDLAEKIKPKVIVAENVKGMLMDKAKWYTREVHRRLTALGYTGQVFLLNGATMGLPQRRERVFFVYSQKALNLPKLTININEEAVVYRDIRQDEGTSLQKVTPLYIQYWNDAKPGKSVGKFAVVKRQDSGKVPNTIVASSINFDSIEPRLLYKEELLKIGSFPRDYNFLNIQPHYLIGMSVPPLMMAHVASAIYEQWGTLLLSQSKKVSHVKAVA